MENKINESLENKVARYKDLKERILKGDRTFSEDDWNDILFAIVKMESDSEQEMKMVPLKTVMERFMKTI